MGRDELRNWVFRIVAELVGADPEELEPDDSLYDIGMQSITLMQFLEIVRNEQGSTLSYESAINAQSLGGLIDALKREGERTSASGSPETGQIEDPEDGTFPLSVMSHAYWAGRQDKSDGSGFAAHFYHEFTSQQIDPTTLAKAVDKLYARHSMLRAAIDSSGRQRVLDVPAHPGCTHHDLRNLDDKKAEEKLLEIRDELSNKAMDISRGEVLDVHLTSLPSGKSVTHILLDMGVADARSFRNILNDLAAFYNGRDAEMPAITTQYRDCLPLMFDKERENADKLWWKKRLGSMGRAPELPLAPKANTPQHRSYRLSFYLSRDELQNLASFSRKIKVTQTATLLAVFTKVVSTWSQNDHFLINVPVFSRPVSIPDIDKVVGDFTGSVILTMNGLSTTCGESCQEANELLAEALSHKEYPGVKVLRDLGRKRGETARAPIVFTSAMGIGELFSSEFRETLGRPSWIVSHSPYVWLDAQTSILDGRLHVNWDVRDGVLADGVAEAMFEAFEALLRRIASGEVGADDEMDVGLPASQASTRLERQRRADSLGISAQPEGLLHGRLLEQAAANPLALAVVDGEGGTTYADLARRAGSVAAALADAGAGPGDRVAVCMPKGALQIASVLGALMAGCCYVPIDPHLPEARKAAVLEEASPKVLLAPACEAGGWAVGAAAIDPSEVPDRPRPDVPRVLPSDPAYVIFTSGSTGVPRGVVVSHGAAKNTVEDVCERFGVSPSDVALGVSGLGFDLSVFDVFGVLGRGGSLVLVEQGGFADPSKWLETCGRFRVTLWNSAPAQMSMLLDSAGDDGRSLSALRLVLLSGDWVPVGVMERVRRFSPDAEVVALGGATEAAIWSNFHIMDASDSSRASVPYGVALAHQSIDVCGPDFRSRPDHVVGDICISGAGLADGYLGHPELTSERFVVGPDGVRRYVTGDLGRWLPEGEIEFLGRRDTQVKIRGNRIELSEVEAVISKCRGVKSAIVILHGKGETASLRAAIVLDPDATLSEKELIHQQSAALPSAAICTTFAFVESLPVNANGKIDRKAVAEMLATIGEAKAPADPPRKGIESEVASLWSRILETETPGRRESFFSLGGDSLLGTRLIAELRKDGKMATLADLFEAPVLCDFCQRLSAEEQKNEWIIDANDTNKYAPFPLTSVQKAYLVGRDESLDLGGIDCTFYREYKTENLDEKRLERVIHQIIARHPMLRAQITEGSQCILKNVPNFLIEHYDTPDSMFESMARKSFNPSSWPLFALGIAPDLGKTRLGIVFDSIVMDATSVLLFLQELEDGYSGRTALKKSPSLTFRDYVLHAVSVEQDSSKSNVRFSEKEPLPPAPELPLAVDPSTIRHPRFCRLATEVDRNLEELSSICSRNHVTVPALLFACYSETLRRFSGTDALTVTVTTFDRRPIHPDVDKVIGDFTTLMRIAYCSDGTEVWSDRVRSATRKLAEGLDDRLGLTVADAEEPRASSHGYPVVFTAALGVEDKFAEHGRVFGQYVRGLSQTPQTWLDCQASKSEGKIILNWDYVEGLFPRGFLEEAFAYFKSLVEWSSIDENWAATPPEPLDLAIVRSERSTAIKRKTYETLHEGFFAYAEREPDRIALAFGNEQVTYSALRDLALRIAGKLQKDGCSIGSSVVVNTSNFVFRTASALGSLAAGAVYIPIGPDQPDIRTKSIISLCSPNALLTDEHVSEMNSWAPLSPNHIVADKDLAAYTIFTSGTTGEPKGIKISHAQAMCTVNAVSQFCPANPRTLSVSACDFDLSVFDIFGTLSTGGMIVSAETEDRRDSQSFVEAASKWRATVWNSVPALLEMALEVSDSNDLESMETILVSGDKVPLDLLARVKEKAPHARLIAMGGATECSIWSNWFDPEEEPGWESASPAWASMPYGRPLPRQEFFVEGKTGEVCPIWTTGELVISGDAVGLGYINASGGFFDVEGKRCYKTGDIGRVRPGGIIEILGRQDNQIKIGGSRIELGEIESAAEQCQGIGKAVAGQITSSSLGKGIGLVVERTFDALTPPGNLKIEVAPCCAGTDSLDKDEVVSTIKNTIQALADQNFPAEFELLKTTWEAWMASNHETTSVKADLDTVSLLIRIIKGEAPISEIEGSKKLNPESQILSTKSSASALLVMKDIAAEAASTSLCALDSSKEIIEVVTEDASLCTFFPGANTPTIEEKASFDMVLAPFSMHRFSSRIAALKRARALMKPEGHLVMSEFDRLSPAAMLSTVVMSKGQLNPESIKERSSTICPAQLWVEDAATCGLSFVRGCKLEGGSYVLVFSREENGETTERDMREWLSLRLPPSHMPRSITFVDSLPLSRNGKIDRALALKIAEKSKSKTRNEPREGLEAAIALIFGEALSSSALDRKASIFELGGDSLSAAKISRAIQLKICPDITLREVLDNPSVEGVASVLSLKHGIFAVEFEEGEI